MCLIVLLSGDTWRYETTKKKRISLCEVASTSRLLQILTLNNFNRTIMETAKGSNMARSSDQHWKCHGQKKAKFYIRIATNREKSVRPHLYRRVDVAYIVGDSRRLGLRAVQYSISLVLTPFHVYGWHDATEPGSENLVLNDHCLVKSASISEDETTARISRRG